MQEIRYRGRPCSTLTLPIFVTLLTLLAPLGPVAPQSVAYAAPLEKCDDGVDNDGDGDVDCADEECGKSALCMVALVRSAVIPEASIGKATWYDASGAVVAPPKFVPLAADDPLSAIGDKASVGVGRLTTTARIKIYEPVVARTVVTRFDGTVELSDFTVMRGLSVWVPGGEVVAHVAIAGHGGASAQRLGAFARTAGPLSCEEVCPGDACHYCDYSHCDSGGLGLLQRADWTRMARRLEAVESLFCADLSVLVAAAEDLEHFRGPDGEPIEPSNRGITPEGDCDTRGLEVGLTDCPPDMECPEPGNPAPPLIDYGDDCEGYCVTLPEVQCAPGGGPGGEPGESGPDDGCLPPPNRVDPEWPGCNPTFCDPPHPDATAGGGEGMGPQLPEFCWYIGAGAQLPDVCTHIDHGHSQVCLDPRGCEEPALTWWEFTARHCPSGTAYDPWTNRGCYTNDAGEVVYCDQGVCLTCTNSGSSELCRAVDPATEICATQPDRCPTPTGAPYAQVTIKYSEGKEEEERDDDDIDWDQVMEDVEKWWEERQFFGDLEPDSGGGSGDDDGICYWGPCAEGEDTQSPSRPDSGPGQTPRPVDPPRAPTTPQGPDDTDGSSHPGDKAGDPVTLVNGDLVFDVVDLDSPGSEAAPLALRRTYRSQLGGAGALGKNWTTNLVDERLWFVPSSGPGLPAWCDRGMFADLLGGDAPAHTCVMHLRGDGYADLYLWDSARGAYLPEAGSHGIIARFQRATGASTDHGAPIEATQALLWRLRRSDGHVTEFAGQGHVLRKVDAIGRTTTYHYEAAFSAQECGDRLLPMDQVMPLGCLQLRQVTDYRGHSLTLEYGVWGLLKRLSDHTGRQIRYCYDLGVQAGDGGWGGDLPSGFEAAWADHQARFATAGCDTLTEGPLSMTRAVSLVGVPQTTLAVPGAIGATLSGELRQYRHPQFRERALLRVVEAVPTTEPGAYESWGAAPVAQRYVYSQVQRDADFLIGLSTRYPGVFGGPVLSYAPLAPPAFEGTHCDALRSPVTDEAWAAYEAHYHGLQTARYLFRRAASLEGLLIRVEHDKGADELIEGASVSADGARVIELEVRYDWDPASETLGWVEEQRYGSDPGAVGGAPLPTGPAPELAGPWDVDGWLTDLPLFRFDYQRGAEGEIPPALEAALQARGIPRSPLSCHAFAQEMPADGGDTTFTIDLDHVRAMIADGLSVPASLETAVDQLAELEGRIQLELPGARQRRLDGARYVCGVTTTTDRSGVVTHHALNFMGRTLLSAVETPAGLHLSEHRYNADGLPVFHETASGSQVLSTYDEGSPNPLARGQLVRREVVGGAPYLPVWLAPEHVEDGPEVLVETFEWEPVAGRLARYVDARGLSHERLYEYQESSAARAAAADLLSAYAVPREVVEALPVVGDVNGDGSSSGARPFVVAERSPAPADATPAWLTTTVSYNDAGMPAVVITPAGHRLDRVHAPTFDDWSVPSEVDAAEDPWLRPPGSGISGGGGPPTLEREVLDRSGLAQTFPDAPATLEVTTQWSYGLHGRPIALVQPDGTTLGWAWDGHGRVAETIDPDGSVRISYDGRSRPTRHFRIGLEGGLESTWLYRDALGAVVATCRDGWMGGCSESLSATLALRDSGAPQLALETTERRGEDRVTRIVSPEGRQTVFAYDALGQVVERRGSGALTQLTYDAGRLIGTARVDEVSGERIATEWALGGLGQRIARRDPLGRVALTRFDAALEPSVSWQLGADGKTYAGSHLERDAAGYPRAHHVWRLGDPLATRPQPGELPVRTTSLTLDALGRTVAVALPDGRSETFVFAPDGALLSHTDTEGVTHSSVQDPTTREALSHRAQGGWSSRQATKLDWEGRPLSVTTEAAGRTTRVDAIWDDLGRLEARWDADGTRTRFVYDALGRVSEVISNRSLGAETDDDYVASFEWDRDGLARERTDSRGNTTAYLRDDHGRTTKRYEVGPLGGLVQTLTEFDRLGRVGLVELSDGTPRKFAYASGSDRVLGVDQGSYRWSYAHDPLGRLEVATVEAPGAEITTSRGYDAESLRAETTTIQAPSGSAQWTVQLDYDGEVRPKRLVTPKGVKTSFDYQQGRLSRITGTGGSKVVVDLTWQGQSLGAEKVALNGAHWFTRERGLDAAGRIDEMSVTHAGGERLLHHRRRLEDGRVGVDWLASHPSGYGKLGALRVPSYTGQGFLARYDQVDMVDRGTFEALPSSAEAGSYAANEGAPHELPRSELGAPKLYKVGGETQWTQLRVSSGYAPYKITDARVGQTQALGWDARGRLETQGQLSYEWTERDLLRRAHKAGALVEERLYDALGRAVRVVTPEGVVDRAFVGQSVVEEWTACGRRSWWLGAQPDGPVGYELDWDPSCGEAKPAALDAHLAVKKGMGKESFGLAIDLQGHVASVIDVTGQLVEWATYDVYGDRHLEDAFGRSCKSSVSKTCGSRFGSSRGFMGRHYSRSTGLYDVRARSYHPVAGWLSRDPAGLADGPDPYGFVGGEPMGRVDLDGRQGQSTAGLPPGAQVWQEDKPLSYYFPLVEEGEYAAKFWADKAVNEGGIYWVPGLFASLWTPTTAADTTLTLVPFGRLATPLKATGSAVLKGGGHLVRGSVGTRQTVRAMQTGRTIQYGPSISRTQAAVTPVPKHPIFKFRQVGRRSSVGRKNWSREVPWEWGNHRMKPLGETRANGKIVIHPKLKHDHAEFITTLRHEWGHSVLFRHTRGLYDTKHSWKYFEEGVVTWLSTAGRKGVSVNWGNFHKSMLGNNYGVDPKIALAELRGLASWIGIRATLVGGAAGAGGAAWHHFGPQRGGSGQ